VGSGNDLNPQRGNFVSKTNAPAAPAGLSPLHLRRLSQSGYTTIAIYSKAMMAKPSVTPAWPRVPSFPPSHPERLPSITTASLAFSHGHRTPPTPAPPWREGQSCDQADRPAHGRVELPPSWVPGEQAAEKSLFPHILNTGARQHLSCLGYLRLVGGLVRDLTGACKGHHGGL